MRITIYIILFFSFTHLILPQDLKNRQESYAQAYLKNGNFEDAARIYTELFNEFPKETKYFRGLVSSLKPLNRFNELIPYTLKYIEYDNDPTVKIFLGELYWRIGKSDLAREEWNKSKKLDDEYVWRFLIQTQTDLKLFSLAKESIIEYRRKSSSKDFMSDEIIKIFIALGDYENGLQEVLNNLYVSNNLQLTKGRLYALMISDEANSYILDQLKKESNNRKNNIFTQEIFAWFLRTINRNEEAFSVYVNIDNINNAKGKKIISFANDSRKDKSFDISLKAYEFVIDNSKYHKYIDQAVLGYARTLEDKMKDSGSIDNNDSEVILKRYTNFIKDYPKSRSVPEVYFRIAQIHLSSLNDLNRASENFEKSLNLSKSSIIGAKSAIELSKIWIRNKEFDKSEEKTNWIIYNQQFRRWPDILAEAQYLKTITNFYTYKFKQAKIELSRLIAKSNTTISNDALELQLIFQLAKDNEEELKLIANAEFQKFSLNENEAIDLYIDFTNSYPKSDLKDICIMSASELLFKSQNYDKLIRILDEFKFTSASSVNMDLALVWLARSYEQKKLYKESIDSYTKLIVDFPNSIYINESREKVRELRELIN